MQMNYKYINLLLILLCLACKEQKKENEDYKIAVIPEIKYADGFNIEKTSDGISIIKITSPWPESESEFTYALIPKEKLARIRINKDAYDAIIPIPVEKIVVTSTTHIPALEALGIEDALVGFPDTEYISSEKTRKRIDSGFVKELGKNESMNTEMLIELQPDVVIGFSISSANKTYETIQRSNIPVVYNGDWMEKTPLGKAEWIKFFAPFVGKESEATTIFNAIEKEYVAAKTLAATANQKPTVISGAMYKDIWYLPGGKSWAAQFLTDANAYYLWESNEETGSLSLSWESVLERGKSADYWIGPAQFATYNSMSAASQHYEQFDAFSTKKVFTFSSTKGPTGGLIYYELAPQRPDLVLKDLIHILHPSLLPEHQTVFFKALQ